MISKKPAKIFLSLLIPLFALAVTSCVDDGPASPNEEPIEVVSDLATDKIEHTHTIGSDPCPQDVSDPIKIYPALSGEDTATLIADSVVIENPSTGLTAEFEGGGTSSTLPEDRQKETLVKLKFTCAIAESFTHKYKLVFFKDGVKVREEEVEVVVTVKG